MVTKNAISLEQLLLSRDRRVEHQRELLEKFPGASLICFTVMLPGPVKRDWRSLIIADAGLIAISQAFAGHLAGGPIMYKEERDLETGFEAYFVVDMRPLEVKRLCCSIEDEHPLGRLMDIDVVCHFDRSGEISLKPLSREDIGLAARHCLLCDKPARECMRAHRHSPEEIQDTIDRMVQDYNSR